MITTATLIAYLAEHGVQAFASVNCPGQLNVLHQYCQVVDGAARSSEAWEVIPATLTSVRNFLGY